MNEFERIAEMRRWIAADFPHVRLGIGDDAAVIAPRDNLSVVSVDVAVEGVHFDPTLIGWWDIGRRSVVAASSDLAAMGAAPEASLLSLILPKNFDDKHWMELVRGANEGAEDCKVPIVGGNLASGGEVSITVTVFGSTTEPLLSRAGAKPGDGVYLTGTVGGALVGLMALQSGEPALIEDAAAAVAKWRRPDARLVEGRRLREVASAAVDVSDGLVQDLGHICEASSVGAEIDVANLPLAPRLQELAPRMSADPWKLALCSGEEFELLFTAPASISAKRLGTRIGHITEGPAEVKVLDPEGKVMEGLTPGYSHF